MSQENRNTPTKLRKVTYSRATESGHLSRIFFAGDSQWCRDLELLLEDTWKNFTRPNNIGEFAAMAAANPPSLAVIHKDAYGETARRILETGVPKGVAKILVTDNVEDQLGWRRLTIEACSLGVSALALSSQTSDAAAELSQVLSGMLSVGLVGYSVDFDTIRKAMPGFELIASTHQPAFMPVFRQILSCFTFDPIAVSAANLLGETYRQWRSPKSISSDLHLAYQRVEQLLDGTPLLALLNLAVKTQEIYAQKADIEEDTWQKLVTEAGIGRLAARKLVQDHPKVSTFLAENSDRQRLRSVA